MWKVVWFSFAVLMFIVCFVSEPNTETYIIAFIAWCGGVASLKAWQEFRARRRDTKV